MLLRGDNWRKNVNWSFDFSVNEKQMAVCQWKVKILFYCQGLILGASALRNSWPLLCSVWETETRLILTCLSVVKWLLRATMNYLKVVLETLERVDPWLRPTLSRNVLLLERLILSAVPELMPARLMETLIDVFSSEFGQRAIDNPWWMKQQLVVEALLMWAWCLLFGMQIICKCGSEAVLLVISHWWKLWLKKTMRRTAQIVACYVPKCSID